jgi:hypothetical protein
MIKTAPIFINQNLIYILQDDNYKWLIDEFSVIKIFEIDLQKKMQIQEKLQKNLHFIFKKVSNRKDEVTFFTKKGVFKFAYLLNSDVAFNIIDILEDVEIEKDEPIFGEIEQIYKNRLSEISQSGDFDEISKFLDSFSNFIREKQKVSVKQNFGLKSIILDVFQEIMKTQK